jgi:hypothetical protein
MKALGKNFRVDTHYRKIGIRGISQWSHSKFTGPPRGAPAALILDGNYL